MPSLAKLHLISCPPAVVRPQRAHVSPQARLMVPSINFFKARRLRAGARTEMVHDLLVKWNVFYGPDKEKKSNWLIELINESKVLILACNGHTQVVEMLLTIDGIPRRRCNSLKVF